MPTKKPPVIVEDAASAAEPLVLRRLQRNVAVIPIIGQTPLIPHKWSEKAKRLMLDKQQGKPVEKKEPKSPADEAFNATYWLQDGRPGMPATAFKAAIADAARHFDGIAIVTVKQSIFVEGEGPDQLVGIDGEIAMREDTPRNATGVADLRYRNQVWPWKADLRIEYVASALRPEALLALVDAAGLGGVGDWRPSSPKSKSGTFGRWNVTGEVVENG
jgi:hypothetical protein